MNKYDSEYHDEISFVKRKIVWVVVFIVLLSGAIWLISKPAELADQVIDNALINYEEFQEIYNTCQKINTDLGTIRAVPEDDRMFASFSKAAVVAGKKQQLSRWVEEYNGKSKMWNRSLWKSNALPYQLNVNDFSNFKEIK